MEKRSFEVKKLNFLVIIPLLFLVAAGVFVKTLRNSKPTIASSVKNYTGEFDTSQNYATFENRLVTIPSDVYQESETKPVLSATTPSEKWIEVDLSDQKIKAWDGANLFLESLVSTGLPWWPTPKGEFHIWIKLRAAHMEGGEGKYYYNLPNVPYVMFFENAEVPRWRGYGLHGTYWHNDFGKVHSHGCVNLPTQVAEKLYHWTSPALPDKKSTVYASDENPGTRIVIHE